MIRRGRGSKGRYCVLDPKLGKGNDVHVALDHHNGLRLSNRIQQLVETIDLTMLMKNVGFRGVEVLGLTVTNNTTTKSNGPTAAITNGKHDAIPKPVHGATWGLLIHQSSGLLDLQSLCHRKITEPRGSVADLVPLRQFTRDPATSKVIDGLARLRMAPQLLLVKFGGALQGIKKGSHPILRLTLAQVAILSRHLETMNLGKSLNGLRETQSVIVHQETDGRPPRTTAKAVIKLLGATDREAWRFFVMERATRGVVTPRAFERDAGFDQLNEISSRQKVLYERIRNSACHVPRTGTSHGGPDGLSGMTDPFGYRTNLP